jgi:putative transposase
VLIELFHLRGVPKYIRCDNDPEFIAKTIRRWLEMANVNTLYIDPGAPWQNGFAGAFTVGCVMKCWMPSCSPV